jgi:hypothetical protein
MGRQKQFLMIPVLLPEQKRLAETEAARPVFHEFLSFITHLLRF